LVSKPSFDPNVFVKGIDSATWKEYEKNSSLVNRMTMSQIPPGSTFKVVTGLAGLYYHAITPDFTINDPVTSAWFRSGLELPSQKLGQG